tara:strand:- start:2377 stop:2754 length:378 start_codon:yes stop_codon:yes gene_type:complete
MANEIKRLIKSFGHALKGLKILFSSQRNAIIHLCLMGLAVILGVLLKISFTEWAIIVLSSGMVIAAESFNTALEKLSDTIHPERNEGIGSAKDIAAGSVLITAIAALVVGIIIFIPKLYLWISSI